MPSNKKRWAPGILVPTLVATAVLLAVPAVAFFIYKHHPSEMLKFAPAVGPTAAIMAAVGAFIGALYVARKAAVAQRQTAKVMETYKTISSRIWDKDYIDARVLFLDAISSGRNLADYVDARNLKFEEEKKTRQAINSLANDYETTALAISHDIIDEEFYKEWFRTSYVQDYIKMSPYIHEVRRVYGSPDLFKNFENMAASWAKEIPSPIASAMKQALREVKK